MSIDAALNAGDKLLTELAGDPRVERSKAPTMGNLKRCSYTHDAMIDLMIQHPEMDQNHLAAHFGYTPGWVSNILASDAFQARMALRRDEIVDPALKATVEERFKALVIQSLDVLRYKLANSPSDNVALRAAELGAKALGLGGHAPVKAPAPAEDRLAQLASRLLALRDQQPQLERTVAGETISVETSPAP